MTSIDTIIGFIIFILSVVIHELSHGYVALYLGDPTAKYAGRLTLNPLKHIDTVGSIIVPLMTFFTAGFVFGWAKPVPYNPYNLRSGKWGPAFVAAAGPISNLLIAIVLAIVIKVTATAGLITIGFAKILIMAVVTNIFLACFNLVPIPPLDGSKVLSSIIPPRFAYIYEFVERYQLFMMLFLVLVLWKYLTFIPEYLVKLLIFS